MNRKHWLVIFLGVSLLSSISLFAGGLSGGGNNGGGSKAESESCSPLSPSIDCTISFVLGNLVVKVENGKQGVNPDGFLHIADVIQKFVTFVSSDAYTAYLKESQSDPRLSIPATLFKRMVLEGFKPSLDVIKDLQSHNFYQGADYTDKAGTNTRASDILKKSLTTNLQKLLDDVNGTATQNLQPGVVVQVTSCLTDVFDNVLAVFGTAFTISGLNFSDVPTIEDFVASKILQAGTDVFTNSSSYNVLNCAPFLQ